MEDKYLYFKNWQTKIKDMNENFKIEKAKIDDEYRIKLDELNDGYMKKIADAKKPLDTENTNYNKEMKKWLGVCNGEPIDVLSFVSIILKLK